MTSTSIKSKVVKTSNAETEALALAEKGYQIIPLKKNSKIPTIKGWPNAGVIEQTEIVQMFKQYPNMNYGIITGGSSNLYVLDVDEKHDGISGTTSLNDHFGTNTFDTFAVSTPNGGRHFYFSGNGSQLKNRVGVLPGVDFRGDGGFAVGPGCKIGDKSYLRVNNQVISPLPDQVVQLISQTKKLVHIGDNFPLSGVPEGERDDAIFKYALRLRGLSLSHSEAWALVDTKAKNCQPPFPEAQALKCLNSAWNYNQQEKTIPKGFDGAELLSKNIPEPTWIVAGILPVGLTLLAGKPKSGKSWLSLDLATNLATAGELFESHAVTPGHTIMLSLEDTPYRIKSRLSALNVTALSKGDIRFYTDWPLGGADLLEEQINQQTGTKLVVVDTLARFRHKAKSNSDLYGRDYQDISKLKQVADRNSVAIVVLHHLRKAKSDDPYEMILGTGGINGAADTLWILDRTIGAPSASLFIRGRDVEDQVLSLQFENCRWRNIGDFEYKPSPIELQYLNYLKNGPLSPKELGALTGDEVQTVSKRLQRMVERMMITKKSHGVYASLDSQL